MLVLLCILQLTVAQECALDQGTDYAGNDLSHAGGSSAQDCCTQCAGISGCAAFTFKAQDPYNPPTCYFKSAVGAKSANAALVSGTTGAPPPPIPPAPPTPAGPAADRAKKIVSEMTAAEKYSLLNGIGWDGWNQHNGYYIGNTPAVPRLGVPSLNMQDAANGFRTIVPQMYGQVTSWPCMLAVASSWDTNAVYNWAKSMGAEFHAKGANMILGPSVNVHRVARGGRNAEYISGEDPWLGAKLTPQYVKGIQENNVLTVAKHYVLNNQETNRNTVDSQCDERTMMEVYYPPFKAAIDAGAGAFMCSYNIVNGQHACANPDTLNRDLKSRMNHSGWVMSDWAAVHSFSATAGLDQEMPGSDVDDGEKHWFSPVNLATLDSAYLDDMVFRLLYPMILNGLFDGGTPCSPPDCDNYLYSVKATNPDHVALARKLGAGGAILLKNKNNTLPLKKGKIASIAIVGSACDSKNDIDAMTKTWNLGNYYVIGGSGRVISPDTVKILDGVSARASKDAIHVVSSPSDDVSAAVNAANEADVVITCGATTSTESVDRANLSVDQESFINQVLAQVKVPSVVLLQTPGPVLTPFRDDAHAVVQMFLAGQETGHAWADILFGDVNPAGKLPLTFPVNEGDMVAPCPGTACPYTEKLFVGYRGLHNKEVAYPFGHGLSYTSFAFSWGAKCTSGRACFNVDVKNTGAVAGAEVVQMYLDFPSSASEPPMILRAFARVEIDAGATETVTLVLEDGDVSIWDTSSSAWALARGTYAAHVGSSSRDIRLNTTFVV